MADGDEDALAVDLADLAGVDVLQARAGDALWIAGADNLFQHGVPHDGDLGVVEQALLQDLLGAQLIAAVDEHNFAGEVGQEQGFLNGGVATADDQHLLAAIEEPVTGCAG